MKNKKVKSTKKRNKSHPWRMCPGGKHWVSKHPRIVEPTKKNPDGITSVRGHCRINPSHKDQIYPEEILAIAEKYFGKVNTLPTPDSLGIKNGNKYDQIIAGWTKYWNEVLKPNEPLNPNLVKALIFTESSFKEDAMAKAGKGNNARGLMQITDQTLQILEDENGELKDFLVNINENEATNSNLNICAGTRWLFHKKYLLENKLNRQVSWEETVMEYKAYSKGIKRGEKSASVQKAKFLKAFERLQNGKK